MKPIFRIALIVTVLGGALPVLSQPRVLTIAVAITLTDPQGLELLPSHLQSEHARISRYIGREMRDVFADLERFRTVTWQPLPRKRRYTYQGNQPADFVAHLIVHQFGKIYRNRIVRYASSGESAVTLPGTIPASYEVISQPAMAGRVELRLVDPHEDDILWSATRDSTLLIPCDQRAFLYNPERYPGWTHPDMLRKHMADIVRLQNVNSGVGNMLKNADIWYVSTPGDDVYAGRRLLTDLVFSYYTEIDGNLPLEGRIIALLPAEEDRQQVRLDIGARHGLVPRLRLDVWRPFPSDRKVGQIEVVRVDSTTATARLRKLEKSLRRRGEGLRPDDRVVSRKRASTRRRMTP